MIFSLCVLYNSNFNNKLLDLRSDFNELIIFDNSNKTEYLSYNEKICKKNNIKYITFKKNLGLSYAYNYISKNILKNDDFILLLDADTNIESTYLEMVHDSIINDRKEVYIPISIDKKTMQISSPLIINKKRFKLKRYIFWNEESDNDFDYFMGINNGTVISYQALKEINFFDERIKVYFTDLYLFTSLYRKNIKTKVIKYKNYCDFSFTTNDCEYLVKRLKFLKIDAKTYYKWRYEDYKVFKYFWRLHYLVYKYKKSIECSRQTNSKYRYFFKFFFC